jgi:hypothetical protein
VKYFSIIFAVNIGILESSREEAEITATQILKDAIANLPHGARTDISAYETQNQTYALKRTAVNFDSTTMS